MNNIELQVANALYKKGFIGHLDDAQQFINDYVIIYTDCNDMEDLAIKVADERGIFNDARQVLVDNFDYYRYSLQLASETTYHQISGTTTWMQVLK